jgi:hypothetical protein
MQEPRQLRELAERCFRLARQILDPTDAEMLRSLGRECERRAAEHGAAAEAMPVSSDLPSS